MLKYLRAAFLFLICLLIVSFANGQSIGRKAGYRVAKPIVLKGVQHRVISKLIIKGAKDDCIRLVNCSDITIINCRLVGSNKNGVQIINSKNITVRNCYIENTAAGVYALKSQGICITQNRFKNVTGPFPKGQMVQFDEVYGANNLVSYNKYQSTLGAGKPEDAINMYKTNGTKQNPVQIIGNWIRGGGPSKEGGGIMLGDNGGSYQLAKSNILIDPGQYGIAIAGGTHNSIIGNKIFGRQQPFTNVGIYVWNQHTSACGTNEVSGNLVNFINANGKPNPGWNSGNCGEVAGWDTNNWNADIKGNLLPINILN